MEAVRLRRSDTASRTRTSRPCERGSSARPSLAALTLFDDETWGGDAFATTGNRFGKWADALQAVNRGAHERETGHLGDVRDLVRDLARSLESAPARGTLVRAG